MLRGKKWEGAFSQEQRPPPPPIPTCLQCLSLTISENKKHIWEEGKGRRFLKSKAEELEDFILNFFFSLKTTLKFSLFLLIYPCHWSKLIKLDLNERRSEEPQEGQGKPWGWGVDIHPQTTSEPGQGEGQQRLFRSILKFKIKGKTSNTNPVFTILIFLFVMTTFALILTF